MGESETDSVRIDADDDARMARSITTLVARTEWTGAVIFFAVATIFVGVPLVRGVSHGHPWLGLANAILLGFAGLGLLILINMFVLIPVTVLRYGRAAATLARRLDRDVLGAVLHRSWAYGTPGAITIGAEGQAWLADRSTGYSPVALPAAAIVRADAVAIHRMARPRFRGPAIGVGIQVGGGLIVTVPIGGKASPPPVQVRHAVRLRYRIAGTERDTLIPFGRDRDGARVLSDMLGHSGRRC